MSESRKWDTRRTDYLERMGRAATYMRKGKVVAVADAVKALEAVIRPFDRVNIERNNQKQADFLAECLKKCDTRRVHDLHMVQSAVPLAVHLDLFEVGVASRLDTPRVSLVCAYEGDANGNLYTGFNTEDTPATVEV